MRKLLIPIGLGLLLVAALSYFREDTNTTETIVTAAAMFAEIKHDDWDTILENRLGAQDKLTPGAHQELQSVLREVHPYLARIKMPSGLESQLQQEFMPVVIAIVDGQTTSDRAAARKVVLLKLETFISNSRQLAAGPPPSLPFARR